ncbi:histone methyltransferase [Roridomyces roridus]|uniref:Histone-lysine N-methyltransferase, H3 lysine-36 specific n=1 Tax=Roridomyces roridus TaxID=1738132 RepID=A0AAD7FGR4_9AGAR|nr:histone methyltransferase [Roridomyces roridus]
MSSAPTEHNSDLLPSPLMPPKLEDEAETLPARPPSTSPDTKSDVDMKEEFPAEESLAEDASPPLPADDSDIASAHSARTASKSPTPPSRTRTPAVVPKKKPGRAVQLIGELAVARDAALATFIELSANNYQNKSIGRSREAMEGMTCECIYQRGQDLSLACGEGSSCINRLTQIECLPEDCRCHKFCQNQRFQNKEYADIEIVQTEKKGFGLRAESDITKDTFIYEYLGDVVNPTSFKKRMRDYAEEGIRHFYFMMLQRDEFIDATKSGGIGRFANHSCNPNCYVAKWTVGAHVRMGIFAKRKIAKFEELTFNYNVDRYGHQAQQCYCGEPNCVGFIGGKTQTDIVTVDDLYLDALGITDAAELMALKGTKKKKGKKLDDPDFLPELRPILQPEVPTIMQAVRQTDSRDMLVKLLTRFRLTTDETCQREMLRLRCLSLMKNVLEDYAADAEVITLVVESIRPWPLTSRNKVDDCKIESPLEAAAESEDPKLKELALDLLSHWKSLPVAYRIPKRAIVLQPKEEPQEVDDEDFTPLTLDDPKPQFKGRPPEHWNRPLQRKRPRLSNAVSYPSGFTWSYPYIREPTPPSPPPRAPTPPPAVSVKPKWDVDGIIAAAVAQKAAEDAAAAAAATAKLAQPAKEPKRKHRSSKKTQTPQEKEANKEKRLLKLVGAVVVKCMSKYGKSLERETFKKNAKELTKLIAEKEKKSSSYQDNKLEALSDEKVAKIKKFSKEYIAKVVRKAEKSQHKQPPQATTSAQDTTPNSIEGVDNVLNEMTVEEAMDMDPASDSEGEDEDVEMEMDGPENLADESPAPDSAVEQVASDPRRRPPDEQIWDVQKLPDKLHDVSIVA